MGWYNRSKKDTRDIIVYHASPERISRFRGLSTLKGVKGLYFSPSYKSAIQDWANVVRSHKQRTHPLYQRRERILKELDEFDDKIIRTTNQQEKDFLRQQRDQLSNQFDQVNEKWWRENESEHEKVYPSYKYIFLHKVSVPKYVYDEAMNFWEEISKDFGMHNIGFWAWGEQIFIPSEFLNKLKVINVKKMSSQEIYREYSNLMPSHNIETYSDPDHPGYRKNK